MMILHNDYHHRQVRVNLRGSTQLSPRQVRTARKVLCGIEGCTCGGIAGECPVIQSLDGVPIRLIPRQGGGASVETLG